MKIREKKPLPLTFDMGEGSQQPLNMQTAPSNFGVLV
jgi:hypothetical protein